jgi:integrating conjugative element protein (TIGR03746 family)
VSRFKNEITHLESHVKTLRTALAVTFVGALLLGVGWWSAPRDLTVHVPPDLRSGSTRKWWEVPPESVYAFTFYVFQNLNRWPVNGEEDYPRNLHALSAYLTPACSSFLQQDFEIRRNNGELRQRVRGIYEIPGRGYGDDPAARVKVVSTRDWIVTMDLSADEFYGSEQVKRAFVRYSLKVTRLDIDPEHNPYGLALDCYSSPPERIALPTSATGAKRGPGMAGAAPTAPAPTTPAAQGNSPFMSDTPSQPPSAAQGATP